MECTLSWPEGLGELACLPPCGHPATSCASGWNRYPFAEGRLSGIPFQGVGQSSTCNVLCRLHLTQPVPSHRVVPPLVSWSAASNPRRLQRRSERRWIFATSAANAATCQKVSIHLILTILVIEDLVSKTRMPVLPSHSTGL